MNSIALISALFTISCFALIVHLGNKIANRWLRYLFLIGGIVFSFVITSFIPPLLGDNKLSTSGTSGEYLVYIGLTYIVINLLFFRKKLR